MPFHNQIILMAWGSLLMFASCAPVISTGHCEETKEDNWSCERCLAWHLVCSLVCKTNYATYITCCDKSSKIPSWKVIPHRGSNKTKPTPIVSCMEAEDNPQSVKEVSKLLRCWIFYSDCWKSVQHCPHWSWSVHAIGPFQVCLHIHLT